MADRFSFLQKKRKKGDACSYWVLCKITVHSCMVTMDCCGSVVIYFHLILTFILCSFVLVPGMEVKEDEPTDLTAFKLL